MACETNLHIGCTSYTLDGSDALDGNDAHALCGPSRNHYAWNFDCVQLSLSYNKWM